MKTFYSRMKKAASIESRFEGSKPKKPGSEKPFTKKDHDKIMKLYGGSDLGQYFSDAMRKGRAPQLAKDPKKRKAQMAKYKKDMAKRRSDYDAALAGRAVSVREQKSREDRQRSEGYSCSRCGAPAMSDSRMGSVDVWNTCDHNDRYIQRGRSEGDSYSNYGSYDAGYYDRR